MQDVNADPAAGGAAPAPPPQMPARTAVVVIHGISPQARYGIQDQFATQLTEHLNDPANWGFAPPANAGGPWETDVVFPPIGEPNPPVEKIRPSLIRVHQPEADPEQPARPFVDVYEAYWSPIDKGQTTPLSVLTWLLKNVFVPANTTARLYASLGKIAFDVGYTLAALLLALAAAYAALRTSAAAYEAVHTIAAAGGAIAGPRGVLSFLAAVTHPFNSIGGIAPRAIVALAVSAAGAYLLVQGALAVYNLVRQRHRLSGLGDQALRRTLLAALLVAAGGAALVYGMYFHINAPGGALDWSAYWLLGAAGGLRVFLAVGNDFLVNRLGDVQIYTTQDENSKFFTLRTEIVEVAGRLLVEIVRARDEHDEPLYERVVVAGHSLGSTIAMDMLLRIHEMVEEGGITQGEWRRIRALLTFGTSLEKTKFFFDVRDPSISASYQQWRDDLDGHLFTPNFDVLRGGNQAGLVGIYWANYWYFTDIVANEIASYRSALAPRTPLWHGLRTPGSLANFFNTLMGKPLVCQNARLPSHFPRHVWVHSDYFTDDHFWFTGNDKLGRPYHGAIQVLVTM